MDRHKVVTLTVEKPMEEEMVKVDTTAPYRDAENGQVICNLCEKLYKQLGSLIKHLKTIIKLLML